MMAPALSVSARTIVGLVLPGILLVAGCATGDPQALKEEDVPAAFTGPRALPNDVWPELDWWRQCASPELVTFIATAEQENLELAVAEARVQQAQAILRTKRAVLWPQLSASAQAERIEGSNLTSSLPTANARGVTTVYAVAANTSYQLDVWGLTRANARSAAQQAKAAEFARQAVAQGIVSDVINSYLAVLTLRKRISLATENIAAIDRLLDIIKLRVTTGTSSRLDLVREEAQLQAITSQVPLLRAEEQTTLAALAILLGRVPEGFEVTATDMEALQVPTISPGIPSELLVRRPEIALAEANLASANANVQAARAAFLPQIIVSGDGQYSSSAMNMLFRAPNLAWNLGANILQTIFDGGALVGKRRLAVATQTELIAAYRFTVLNAYAEVETALGNVYGTRTSEASLLKEVAAAHEAFEITQLQYRQGVTDLLAVIQAQETLFGAEDQLAQIRLSRMQATVQLYQALGGGWTQPEDSRPLVVHSSSISRGSKSRN